MKVSDGRDGRQGEFGAGRYGMVEMVGRRSDTKERIQEIALELFAERGYDKTSLKEVADRLNITRPALYYHFKTKEDILSSAVSDLLDSVGELTDWAGAQPRTAEARRAILGRVNELFTDHWLPLMRFSQVNEAAMRDLQVGRDMQGKMLSLLTVLDDPDASPEWRFEARIAVITVMISNVPQLFDDIPGDVRGDIAMRVAARLAG